VVDEIVKSIGTSKFSEDQIRRKLYCVHNVVSR